MLLFDISNQFIKQIFPVIFRDNRLMVNAQPAICHSIKEPVQQGFRQIAHKHKLCSIIYSCIWFNSRLIALQAGQISYRFIQMTVFHSLCRDAEVVQDGAQTRTPRAFLTQVVEYDFIIRHFFIRTNNRH